MKRWVLFTALLLAAACATKHPRKPPLVAPQWDVMPAMVLDALCARLQMDAIVTTGRMAIVDTTQPLATRPALTALSVTARNRVAADRMAASIDEANRVIPLDIDGSACSWRAIPAAGLSQLHDEMVVQLSAPLINPFATRDVGLFARVGLGSETPSWYWVTLMPQGDQWSVGMVHVLVQ